MVSNVCYIIIYCNLIFAGIGPFHYLSPFVCSTSSESDSNWKCFGFPQQPNLQQGQGLGVHGKSWRPFATWKRTGTGGNLSCVFGSGFVVVLLSYYWANTLSKIPVARYLVSYLGRRKIAG